jgi:hypothetical protein
VTSRACSRSVNRPPAATHRRGPGTRSSIRRVFPHRAGGARGSAASCIRSAVGRRVGPSGRWSEWIWSEHEGGTTAHQSFLNLYNNPATDTDLWSPPTANPGEAANLFGSPVYDRGAMTLQALREKIGDTAFFRIMRDWIAQHDYGNGTTAQFIKLAEHDSGRNLKQFFDVWLYQPTKPTSW